jgi:hypothetical protein
VAFKEFYGVFAESCQQVRQPSRSRMIDAEFVNAR